jgi:Mat/Ecp fimbriae major subunit
MKNSFKLFAAALAFVGFANVATAQNSASATGTATARIIEPISISATDGILKFGNIVSSPEGGTVTVTGNGSVSYNGVVALTGWWNTSQSGSQATGPAGFTVSGEPYFHYLTSYPSSVVMTSGESNTMTCTLSAPTHAVLDQAIISNVGYDTFNMGGTLTVAADQPNGSYSGTFTVTVWYE